MREIIISEIKEKGAITFKRFMEISLYHPLGYYIRHGRNIGKGGDFYTSVSLGPLFGRILAKQFVKLSKYLPMNIIEMGCGRGDLAGDISSYLSQIGVDFKYFAIELYPPALNHPRIKWIKSIEELPELEGIFFSNELVDSFPVHVIEVKDGRLMEVYVTWDRGEFKEVLDEPSSSEIERYFEELGVELPDGFRTEVNLDAIRWLEGISKKIKRGLLITIDYGYPSDELYRDYRRKGTLLCYFKHTVNDNPYQRIGDQDITSHVNFSALSLWGKKLGLETVMFTTQAYFLMDGGILDELSSSNGIDALDMRLKAKSLLLPGGMGDIFKVLVQEKGMNKEEIRGLFKAPSFPL